MTDGEPERLRPEVLRVLQAIDDLEAIPDAGERARALSQLLARVPGLHSELRQMRQQAVMTLRQQGQSWQQIGDIIERHRKTAKDIHDGRSGRPRQRAGEHAGGADAGAGVG